MWQIGVNQHLSAETQAKPVVDFRGVCTHYGEGGVRAAVRDDKEAKKRCISQ